MGKSDVSRIHRVFDLLEPVAVPYLHAGNYMPPRSLHYIPARKIKFRGRSLTHKSKYKSKIIANWIGVDSHAFRPTALLGWHFETLPGAVVQPAMVHAANLITLNPPGVQDGASMRASPVDERRFAAGPPIEGEVFAHYPNRESRAVGQLIGDCNWLPERAQEFAHQRICRGLMQQIQLIDPGQVPIAVLHDLPRRFLALCGVVSPLLDRRDFPGNAAPKQDRL